jgi:hypothetical protein
VDTIFGWNTGEGYGFVPDGSATMLINNELNPNPDEPPKLSLERIVQDRLCTTFNNGNVDPIS